MSARAIFVLSDGLNVNGTRLIEGLTEAISDRVVVTGGLAGDGAALVLGVATLPSRRLRRPDIRWRQRLRASQRLWA